MKRVLISGGGTGGHIYPAITIVKEMAKLEETEFLYVGSKNGLESEIVPKEGIPFVTLETQGLTRRLTAQNILALAKSGIAMVKAATIIRKFKPDVVIGTGGFVCGPVLLTAALMGIPTLIQEQNVIAGITNKILSSFVDVVAIGYEDARRAFQRAKRVVYTGNPVRPEVLSVTRDEGRKRFDLEDSTFAVLVAGGSRGARSINKAMIGVHHHFKDTSNLRIIHVTGKLDYEWVIEELTKGGDVSANSQIIPYLHDMPLALAAADLAIFRAGAVGLAEIADRGIPSVLIPYPFAAEDHQTYNAHAFVASGAAKMIVDKFLTSEELISDIEELMGNRELLEQMAIASASLGRPEAAKDIAKLALSIAKK